MTNKNCIICYEYINDPICIYCYIRQLRTYMNDIHTINFVKDYIIKKLISNLIVESANDIRCIICKQKSVNICFYCFSRYAKIILGELNFPDETIDNINLIFNYNSSDYETKKAKQNGYNKEIFEDFGLKGGIKNEV